MFGRSTDDGRGVDEAEFTGFLDAEVSTRFPDGLTVIDAQGRWTSPSGVASREPSKVVMIVLRGAADEPAKLDAIRDAYKRLYQQKSVLLITRPACVSF